MAPLSYYFILSSILFTIGVVGVLMRDQDGVQVGRAVPAVGERPRVDEDAAVVLLHEDRRVAKMSDLHDSTLPREPCRRDPFRPSVCVST